MGGGGWRGILRAIAPYGALQTLSGRHGTAAPWNTRPARFLRSVPAMVTPVRELPWWAHGGSERCPRCLQLFAYEVEYRCVECDGPLCPFCAVSVTVEVREVRCHGCHDEEEG